MSETVKEYKDRIRRIITDRRGNLSKEVLSRCADIISEELEYFVVNELGKDLKTVRVASYMPVSGELSSLPFLSKVIDAGGVVMMPRVDGKDMRFFEVTDFETGFVNGRFGIPEPCKDMTEADVKTSDVVIVPGIAYNDEGIRLGRGGGYYDRLWEALGGDSADRKNVLIGICYNFQIMSSIPVEDHDMAVDILMEVEE